MTRYAAENFSLRQENHLLRSLESVVKAEEAVAAIAADLDEAFHRAMETERLTESNNKISFIKSSKCTLSYVCIHVNKLMLHICSSIFPSCCSRYWVGSWKWKAKATTSSEAISSDSCPTGLWRIQRNHQVSGQFNLSQVHPPSNLVLNEYTVDESMSL